MVDNQMVVDRRPLILGDQDVLVLLSPFLVFFADQLMEPLDDPLRLLRVRSSFLGVIGQDGVEVSRMEVRVQLPDQFPLGLSRIRLPDLLRCLLLRFRLPES